MITILFLLIAGHALCDYPLQGDFLARGKNRFLPLPGVPWYWCLGSHALIHGGCVFLITQNIWLGFAETVIHAIIDDRKCAKTFGFDIDQCLHIFCKILWWSAIILTAKR